MYSRTSATATPTKTTYYLLTNLQGDIIAIYNQSGTKIYEYAYDAWGNIIKSSQVATGGNDAHAVNPFRYRGYYFDTETGFYYLQSRYYNPEWGRFLNADGYISTGTGLLGYNMYIYCNNNPILYADLTGKVPVLALWFLAAGIVAVGIPSAVNHVINSVNKSKIDKEIQENYTVEEAQEEIDDILSNYSDQSNITFNDSAARISESWEVTSRYDRQKISEIISRTGKTTREYDHMSSEWLAHNICYRLHIKRGSTRAVDIDYNKDPRGYVRFGTKILEVLGWD